MRIFFFLVYACFSITFIILILLQKSQGSTNVGINNVTKNLFNVATKSEFLNHLTIICAGIFLILSIFQCSVNNYLLGIE
ncbi:preprotein translocase subunit SecG [Buchnera aphidicola]|uniref:preprotein translocase subunit SecG n=1 Tax=Buchnera aphidicola TaxID=9 RepID=UPI0025439170|nr:preprotein translocase subunit SecG [Buchnera aphidicola]WII23535.1 preprotein translocase subunit SecG [Buchnera aphidicola (Sipha maydis)]